MKKDEVQVGRYYLCNHSSGKVPVQVQSEKAPRSFETQYRTWKPKTHWIALNLKTRREIEVKSAAKFIRELTTEEISRAMFG